MKRKGIIVLGWLIVWQLFSLAIGQSVILAGPFEVLKAMIVLAGTASFWQTTAFTMLRITGGFLLAFCMALISGVCAFKWKLMEEVLAPAVAVMKSVPVVCFVILVLVLAGSGRLTLVIVFLIAFPILYLQIIEGLKRTDQAMLEMAQIFHMNWRNKFRYLYLPAFLPSLLNGCRLALGMSWKSGVAAEVIGTPVRSIGQQLYFAKIYLKIDQLFAWTLVILLCSFLFEKIFLWLLGVCVKLLEGDDGVSL